MEKTIHNYEITYYRPDPNKVPVPGGGTGGVLFTDIEYIYWKDNQGKEGFLAQNNAYNHSLEYWPKWLKDQDKITFKGTLLPSTLSTTGLVTNAAFDWGYADSYSAGDDYKTKQYKSIWYDDKSITEFGALLYQKVNVLKDQGIDSKMPYKEIIDQEAYYGS